MIQDLEKANRRVQVLRESSGHPLDLRRATEEREAARRAVRNFYGDPATDDRWRHMLEAVYPDLFPEQEVSKRILKSVGLDFG